MGLPWKYPSILSLSFFPFFLAVKTLMEDIWWDLVEETTFFFFFFWFFFYYIFFYFIFIIIFLLFFYFLLLFYYDDDLDYIDYLLLLLLYNNNLLFVIVQPTLASCSSPATQSVCVYLLLHHYECFWPCRWGSLPFVFWCCLRTDVSHLPPHYTGLGTSARVEKIGIT